MVPVNVKLTDAQVRRVDEAIAQGRAGNRSDALRLALDHLLREWDLATWNERWEKAIPDDLDEFSDLTAAAVSRWGDLDRADR